MVRTNPFPVLSGRAQDSLTVVSARAFVRAKPMTMAIASTATAKVIAGRRIWNEIILVRMAVSFDLGRKEGLPKQPLFDGRFSTRRA